MLERPSPPKKANSFPRQFCCINIYKSRFFARGKQARASWPFRPLQGTGVSRPQLEASPPPPAPLWAEPRCPHHFVRTRAFHPHFVLPQSSQLLEKGAKAKRKHPGHISRGGFPERGRGRPTSGVGRRGWTRGLRGNWVAGDPRRTPGSCWELRRSSSPWEKRLRVRMYQPRRESLAWVWS